MKKNDFFYQHPLFFVDNFIKKTDSLTLRFGIFTEAMEKGPCKITPAYRTEELVLSAGRPIAVEILF